MEYKRLISKGIQSHTFFSDAFGYLLVKIGVADKFLSGKMSMYRSYRWLNRKFAKHISNNKTVGKAVQDKKVWICWFQGIENAPMIVKNCYESICYWLKDYEIVVITEENYKSYVQFPTVIEEKRKKGIITDAHFSDLLRLE